MTLSALLQRVREAGFEAYLDGSEPNIRPVRAGAELPPDLLPELRRYRQQIIAYLMPNPLTVLVDVCSVCGREMAAADKEVVAGNYALCDRIGSREQRNRTGQLVSQAVPGCPYRKNR